MFKNKKGGLTGWLYSFWVYFLLLLLAVLFGFILVAGPKATIPNIARPYSEAINSNTDLRGLLGAPVEVDGREWEMSDLVVVMLKEGECTSAHLSTEYGRYCGIFKEKLESLLTKSYGDSWSFIIYYRGEYVAENLEKSALLSNEVSSSDLLTVIGKDAQGYGCSNLEIPQQISEKPLMLQLCRGK